MYPLLSPFGCLISCVLFFQFWHELKLEREWRSNSDEKANSETHLKRSPPIVHCSLNWSARLCEQGDDASRPDATSTPEKGVAGWEQTESNGIVPLKQRIDCLNRAIEQTGVKKPKLLPKPALTLSAKNVSVSPEATKSPLKVPATPKESDRSPRRERGKLDKSYSTPSYDYSIDSREPLTFNMKLPEEKVKSAPDNITSEVEPLNEFKKSLDIKPLEVKPEKLEQISEDESKHERNEYLEIKSSEETDPVNKSPLAAPAVGDKVNRILDTIDSTLSFDSEPETTYPCRNEIKSPAPSHFTFGEPAAAVLPCSSKDSDSSRLEETASINSDTLKSTASSTSQPVERLHIHTTINVPATFPRHKMEYKRPIPPPEPPPRPAKGSPIHSKTKSAAVTKSSSKSAPHKSPKVVRKKNVWLTSEFRVLNSEDANSFLFFVIGQVFYSKPSFVSERRNVSVKDLGICDHEGWLFHRSRKMARGSPQWIKGWFIIKGTIFYGFNSREVSSLFLSVQRFQLLTRANHRVSFTSIGSYFSAISKAL